MSRRFVIFLLGLFTALAPVSIDMYLPTLPQIGRALAADAAQLQATLSAFFLGFAGGQALYGPISDRWGRKPPLFVGIGLYIVASVGCATSADIDHLTMWRCLQAIGACAGGVIGRAIVRDLYPPEDAPRLYASLMLVMGVAPILAPLAGGTIGDLWGWRWIFWFSAVLGGVCLLLLLRLSETRPPTYVTPVGLAATLLGYGAICRQRTFLGWALTGGMGSAGMFCYISGSPTVLIDLYHIPPQHFGWYFGINALGLIATAQMGARLSHRISPKQLLRLAQTCQTILAIGLVAIGGTGWGGLWGLLVLLFLFMACQGIVAPMATSLAMADQGRHAGLASSVMGTLQFSISAFASSFVGLLHDGTAMPMTIMMLITALLGQAASRLLIR